MGAGYDATDKKCSEYETEISYLNQAIGWINSASHHAPDKHPGVVAIVKVRDRLQQRYLRFCQKNGIKVNANDVGGYFPTHCPEEDRR